jgi:hypothetical protein
MNDDDMGVVTRTLASIKNVEEWFAKIQKDSARYGSENGLTTEKAEMLEKLIALNGEVAFAAKEICNRILGISET